MRPPLLSLLVPWLASISLPVSAATAGSFADGGNTLVSAMMLFLGNEEKVYILDKAEGNAAQVAGHSAWGSVWDIKTHQTTPMDVRTNVFCASGMHLPNGSYVTFGGNEGVGRGGKKGSQVDPSGNGAWDSEYQDFDGGQAIRILNPCTDSDNFASPNCQWFDDPTLLAMQRRRWYSAAEALADGTIVLIGGFVNGGYINRNTPNLHPEKDGAESTYEFFPANGRQAQTMQFMITTSGLNAYANTYLLASGKMLVQANLSTIIWDYNANIETPLPDMPKGVVRVYPASGAVAMLPVTPANNYAQTILFCGGSDMPDEAWGNYSFPTINTWLYPASKDCQRLTPEPADRSAPAYEQDDDMPEGRTMGQFIILPDGTMLVINGGLNGTAGYSEATGQTFLYGDMPYGMSLASGPVGRPAIYDPRKPKGQRWSNEGLSTSNIARLYHSSAMLLPDGSVLVAGSNPNFDVNLTTIFPTEYRAEIFYPPYFSAKTRPEPTGIPKTISYGGASFDITVPASSYSGSSNAAADSATVSLVRGGFTTHALNMGQRYLQLNNTYTVQSDGTIVLHVSQAPPNPNILQPGPALFFVTINGTPSVGKMVIVGSGVVGAQPTAAQAVLPDNVRVDAAKGSADGSTAGSNQNSASGSDKNASPGPSTGAIIGGVVGAVAILGVLGALAAILVARRRRSAASRALPPSLAGFAGAGAGSAGAFSAGAAYKERLARGSDASSFVPLQQDYNQSQTWNASSTSLAAPYRDDVAGYDPYAAPSARPAATQNRY